MTERARYHALEAAVDMATEDVRRTLRRIVNRATTDGVIGPPAGFKYIDTAPLDGTYIRLRFRPGLGRENWEAVGQWKITDGGFVGWWERNGDRIMPGPLFWAPEHGGLQ